MSNKRYIGDGVYVERDPCGVKLSTSDGISETNVIWLEREVIFGLIIWLREMGILALEEKR